jgi:phosphatidylglycerophosphate synthase
MLDPLARRLIDPPLDRLAAGLARVGLGANAVTVGGFVVGMAGCAVLAFRQYELALGLILVNRLADGLDGAVARRTGATDAGGYLDIVLDLVFYSGVPFGFALGRPEFALPAAFLVWSFVGTGGSFLAYAVVAAKRGVATEARGRKSFYYAAGLMEGTETVAFFALFCLFPDSFVALAWTFGGLCWVTTGARVFGAVSAFRENQTPTPPGGQARP